MKNDRITQACNSRAAIHAFVVANPGCGIRQIGAAHPAVTFDTLRNQVKKLVKDGVLERRGMQTRPGYFAVADYSSAGNVEAIRQRLRSNAMLPPRTGDSIAVAWENRRRIHAWLKDNQGSTIAAISAAFPDLRRHTIIKHLVVLRKNGNVGTDGMSNSNQFFYRATTAELQSEMQVRDRMREVSVPKASRTDDDSGPRHGTQPAEPWRTVNRPDFRADKRNPNRGARGQGAVAFSCCGYSMIAVL